jgi:hypothetical protein
MTDDSWGEYRRLVLSELERVDRSIRALHADVTTIKSEVTALKIKSGVWGLLGGLIPVVVAIGVSKLF